MLYMEKNMILSWSFEIDGHQNHWIVSFGAYVIRLRIITHFFYDNKIPNGDVTTGNESLAREGEFLVELSIHFSISSVSADIIQRLTDHRHGDHKTLQGEVWD